MLSSARALNSVSVAGKHDSRLHSTTGFSECLNDGNKLSNVQKYKRCFKKQCSKSDLKIPF